MGWIHSRRCRCRVQRPHLKSYWGWFSATPSIRTSGKSCDGGVLFAKQHLLRLGIILLRLPAPPSQIADVGVSGIVIDVVTLKQYLYDCLFHGAKVFIWTATPVG